MAGKEIPIETTRTYYDVRKLLSYGAQINVIIGSRSIGKTYGLLKQCVQDWLKDGSEFGYIRRYGSELEDVQDNILDDVAQEFPNYQFRRQKDKYLIRKISDNDSEPWLTIGHLFVASKAGNYKGKPYPRVKRIVWDEYVRELNVFPGYLKNDIQALFSIYTSVARYRTNVAMYLLGNACDLIIPIFLFLGVDSEPKSGVTQFRKYVTNLDGSVTQVRFLIDYVKDAKFIEQVRASTFGALVAGTDEETVIVNGDFSNAGDLFIAKKPKSAKYHYGFKFRGATFGVWLDQENGRYYVNRKTTSDGVIYALSAQDMRPNLVLIEQAAPFLRNLRRLYGYNMVYFDSPATREGFVDMVRLVGVR